MTLSPESCPTKIALDRFLLKELEQEEMEKISGHIKMCRRCGDYLEESQTLERELTRRATENQFVERLTRRLSSSAECPLAMPPQRPFFARPRWKVVFAVGTSFLACVVVVFTLYLYLNHPVPPSTGSYGKTTRIKGTNVFKVFCRRGKERFLLEPGMRVSAGDDLRFEVFSPDSSQLLVIGLQSDGEIAVYAPFKGRTSIDIPPGRRALLAGSVVLDNYPGDELLIAVFSKHRLKAENVIQKIKQAYRKSRGNLLALRSLNLPHISIEVHLLHREDSTSP